MGLKEAIKDIDWSYLGSKGLIAAVSFIILFIGLWIIYHKLFNKKEQ